MPAGGPRGHAAWSARAWSPRAGVRVRRGGARTTGAYGGGGCAYDGGVRGVWVGAYVPAVRTHPSWGPDGGWRGTGPLSRAGGAGPGRRRTRRGRRERAGACPGGRRRCGRVRRRGRRSRGRRATRRWAAHAGGQVEQGRLARPVGPDDGADAACRQPERAVIQGAVAAAPAPVGISEAVCPDRDAGHRSWPPSRERPAVSAPFASSGSYVSFVLNVVSSTAVKSAPTSSFSSPAARARRARSARSPRSGPSAAAASAAPPSVRRTKVPSPRRASTRPSRSSSRYA
ncbi:hypothetical protein SCALM49S_01548 [Streptomyces californicus]